jgi:hypothetical protein
MTVIDSTAIPLQRRRASDATAGAMLSLLLLAAVAAFGCWLVGGRDVGVGTDTYVYAGFFESLGRHTIETRLEPGFVYLSYALRKLGLGVTGYQTALFALLLGTAVAATHRYFKYLGDRRGYLTFLSAALMLLFVSPMFVNGSINAIRQGLAALLVFASLLSFYQRRWWPFAIYGALASSLHFSSLMYLAFSPLLLVSPRLLRYVAAGAFLMYVSGLSTTLVRMLLPSLYELVMEYTANSYYRSGVRIDFAVFSIFWYALPHVLAPLVRSPYKELIKDSTAIYLVMLLPFFAVGWGYFSNRYLLPGWFAVSIILAAMVCHSRVPIVRHPLVVRMGLLASCAVFYFYVTNEIVI